MPVEPHPVSEHISDDLIREQAYLVARGVRPMAIIGHCDADPLTMLRVATRVESLSCEGVTPFVLNVGDGQADFGLAAHPWVLDLYRWAREQGDAVPAQHRNRIIGLLLGYSVDAVRRFVEISGGRLFEAPNFSASAAPASS